MSVADPGVSVAAAVDADALPAILEAEHLVRAEQVRLLFAHLRNGVAASALVAVVVVAVLHEVVDVVPLLAWFATTLLTAACCYLAWRRFRVADPDCTAMPAWERRYVFGAACYGLCWGLGAALPLFAEREVHQAFVGFVLAGLAAGALATMSSSARAYAAFLLPALIPFVLRMQLDGDALHFAMGSITLLFAGTMLVASGRLAGGVRDSLHMRFRNVHLLGALAEANVRLNDGNAALATEVFERRGAQEVLRRSEQRLRLHLEQTPLAFIEWDLGFRAIEWNPAAERMFGYPRSEAVGRHALRLIAGDNVCSQVSALWKQLIEERRGASTVIENRTRTGETIACQWYYTPLVDADGRVVSVITLAQDVTSGRLAEEQLRYLAHHDELTGLANRALFHDRLLHAVAEARRDGSFVGVMLLDVDHFKVINDSMGHEAGDAVLREVAVRVRRCMRETDTLARFGGDEFAVLAPSMDSPPNALTLARKILDAFEPPFLVEDREVFLSASIGMSFYPLDGHEIDGLLKNAHAAMYHAKSQGRNNFQFYSAELTARAQTRLAIETSLRHALDRGEFRLHYQPKIELASGRIIGVEALLRWQSPTRGLIGPAQFIPVAEESGLIVPVGDWVLREACREAGRWAGAGIGNIGVAVNLSSRQFRHKGLVNDVTQALEESGLDPQRLEFEITESVLMDHDPAVSATLSRFRDLGVSIAIDDFGTGYSSLSYLKRFPIDTLKIDRSFVRDVSDDGNDAALVRAIISMAHSLRMRTVAEGVELPAQAAFLRAEGCELAQGFLYSEAVPGDRLPSVLLHRTPADGGPRTDH